MYPCGCGARSCAPGLPPAPGPLMRLADRLAFLCYGLVALLAVAFGLVYLTRSEFMPYHGDAVGMPWAELDPRLQTLLLALLRLAGGGFLAAGIALGILLLIPFRRGDPWVRWALPLVGLASALPTLLAVLLVQNRTPARPPIVFALLAVALIVIGAALSLRAAPSGPDRGRKAVPATPPRV
jgi:hypothetical protein